MMTLQTGLLPIIRRVRRPLMPPESTPEPQAEKKAESPSQVQEQSDESTKAAGGESQPQNES